MITTETAEQLAKDNLFNRNYDFKTADYIWGQTGKLEYYNEPQYIKDKVNKDLEILKKDNQKFLDRERSVPAVGDALLLPNGKYVYFCHVWDDHAQTTIMGSFCLFGSGFSYSGGLDSGLKLEDIKLTDKEYGLPVWFPHNGSLQAQCAIYATAKTRVWKCKKGADLSGVIWEGKREEKY